MSTEKALPTKEVIEKLQNLKELLGKSEDPLLNLLPYFGKHLIKYLDDELYPEGFVRSALLAINDLKFGKSGIAGEDIDDILRNHPKIIYHFLWDDIPSIVEVVFPEEFAVEVKRILKNMKDE